MKSNMLIAGLVVLTLNVFAQVPTNSSKSYEYSAEQSVRKASSGDLVLRFEKWGKEYFKNHSASISVDDTTQRYVEIQVTEKMVENHFSVNRTHKNRALTYHIKFDTDRKDYTYWINGFKYEALEIDKKGNEISLSGPLEELKTPARKSLLEEINERMTVVISELEKGAEIEIED